MPGDKKNEFKEYFTKRRRKKANFLFLFILKLKFINNSKSPSTEYYIKVMYSNLLMFKGTVSVISSELQ